MRRRGEREGREGTVTEIWMISPPHIASPTFFSSTSSSSSSIKDLPRRCSLSVMGDKSTLGQTNTCNVHFKCSTRSKNDQYNTLVSVMHQIHYLFSVKHSRNCNAMELLLQMRFVIVILFSGC